MVSLLSPKLSPMASKVSSSIMGSDGLNVAPGSVQRADFSVNWKSPLFAPRNTRSGNVPTPLNSPRVSVVKMPVRACQSS